jgi:hypothetical protein
MPLTIRRFNVRRIGSGERLPPQTPAPDAAPSQGAHTILRRLWAIATRLPPSVCGDERRPSCHPSSLAICPLRRRGLNLPRQLLGLPRPSYCRPDACRGQFPAPFPRSSAGYCARHGNSFRQRQRPSGEWCGVHARQFCRAVSGESRDPLAQAHIRKFTPEFYHNTIKHCYHRRDGRWTVIYHRASEIIYIFYSWLDEKRPTNRSHSPGQPPALGRWHANRVCSQERTTVQAR